MAEIAQAANPSIAERRSPWRTAQPGRLVGCLDRTGLDRARRVAVRRRQQPALDRGGPAKMESPCGPRTAAQGTCPAVRRLFVLWSVAFGIGAGALGIRISRFLPAFLLVYLAAGGIYLLGQWDQAAHYNLEPPLVALGVGLLISNTRAHLAGSIPDCGWSSTSRPASYCWAQACR